MSDVNTPQVSLEFVADTTKIAAAMDAINDRAIAVGKAAGENLAKELKASIENLGTVKVKGEVKVDGSEAKKIAKSLKEALASETITPDIFKQLKASLEGKKIDIGKNITADNIEAAKKAAEKLTTELQNELDGAKIKLFNGGSIDTSGLKEVKQKLTEALNGSTISNSQGLSITKDIAKLEGEAQTEGKKLGKELVDGLKESIAGQKFKVFSGENIDTSEIARIKEKVVAAVKSGSLSNSEGLSIAGSIPKLEGEAEVGGQKAGQKLGSALKTGLTAILSTISLNAFIQGILSTVEAANQATRANNELSQTVTKLNDDYTRNAAILDNSKSTVEQKAEALGISVDKLYKEADATKDNAAETQRLEAQIRNQTRAFEDSNRTLEASIRTKEQETLGLDRQVAAIDRQIYSINRESQAKERQISQKDLEIRAIDRTITANERESKVIEDKIKVLDNQYNIKVRQLNLDNGGSDIDAQINKLEVQKNQLEVQKDIQDIQDKSSVVVQTSFESILLQVNIDKLNLQLKLQQDKRDAINLQVDALKKQEERQKTDLEIQKQGIDAQKLGFQVQKDALEVQLKQLETEKQLIEFRKQDSEAQKQAIEATKAELSQSINDLRQQLDSKKAQFDIDITPAKRNLEDLQAKITALNEQIVKNKDLNQLGIDVKGADSTALGIKPPSEAAIKATVRELTDKFGKYLKETDISRAFSNILDSGVTDLAQVSQLFTNLAVKASGGKDNNADFAASFLEVTRAYKDNQNEGLKNNGVQVDLQVMTKKGAAALIIQKQAIIDSTTATKEQKAAAQDLIDRYRTSGEGGLSIYEQNNAKLIGTLQGTAATQEDFQKNIENGTLALDQADVEINKVRVSIGQALSPALVKLVEDATPVIDKFAKFVKDNPELVRNIALIVGGFLGVATILGITAAAVFVFTNPLSVAIGVILGAVSALGYLYNALKIQDVVNELGREFKSMGDIVKSVFDRLPDIIKFGLISALRIAIGLINDLVYDTNKFLSVFQKLPGGSIIPDIPKIPIPGYAKGGDFMVPPGFDNDSYLMRVQSGERVQVTPSNQVSGSYNKSSQVINYNNYGNNQRNFLPQMLLQY